MKCFIAITDTSVIEQYAPLRKGGGHPPLDVLISLPYVRDVQARAWMLKEQGIIGQLFLDAGTYTLNAGGRTPGLDNRFEEYMDYLRRFGARYDLIAAYDADFKDPEYNQCFYQQMLMHLKDTDLRERIVPVVHDRNNAAEEFLGYIEAGARVIAIGSYPPLAPKQWGKINWLRQKHGVAIHLFGNMKTNMLRNQLPESVDTAQYAIGPKFGAMMYWDGNRRELVSVNILNPREFRPEHMEFIETTFGWKPIDLLADVSKQWIVGIDAICRLQDYLNNVWYPDHDVADFEIGD